MSVSPSTTLSSTLSMVRQWAAVITWVLDTRLPPHKVVSSSLYSSWSVKIYFGSALPICIKPASTFEEQSGHPWIIPRPGIVTVRAEGDIDAALDVLDLAAGETALCHRGLHLRAAHPRDVSGVNGARLFPQHSRSITISEATISAMVLCSWGLENVRYWQVHIPTQIYPNQSLKSPDVKSNFLLELSTIQPNF